MTPVGAALLVAAITAVALTATWAARSLSTPDPLERALVATLGGITVLPAVGIVLGAVGLLRPVPVLLALVAVSGVLAAVLRSQGPPAVGERRGPANLTIVGLAIAGLALVGSLRVGFEPGRSLHFESQHYHLAAVAHFREAGTIWTPPFQNPPVFTASHPALAELTSTIISFTTDSDRLIYGWMHASSALLAMLGAALLVRELGGRPVAGALAALAVLLSPLAIISVHSIANDLLPVAGLVASGALVLRARAPDAHRWTLACAGVALGLALGTKYTAFAGAALIVLMALVVRHGRRTLWLLPGSLALGLPWLIRNWLAFDNPLYPQAIRVAGVELFAGGSGPYDRYSGTVFGHVAARRTDAIDTWIELIRRVTWPVALAALVGIVLVLPLARRRDPRAALAAAILGAGLLLAYLVTPYTGGGVPPAVDVMGSNLRYLLPALLVGCALLAAVVPKPYDLVVVVPLLGWSVWRLVERPMRPDLELTTPIVLTTLLITLTWGVAWIATATFRDATSDSRPRRIAGAAFAWAIPLTLLVGAIAVDAERSDAPVRPLEASVSQAVAAATGAPDAADVAVVGITDLRSVTGEEFERDIDQVTDVKASAPLDASELDQDVAAVDAPVLVVGQEQAGIPSGYVPPADVWCPSDVTDDYAVYVRQDVEVDCPAVPVGG